MARKGFWMVFSSHTVCGLFLVVVVVFPGHVSLTLHVPTQYPTFTTYLAFLRSRIFLPAGNGAGGRMHNRKD
jgi:uncharacterized membrane protein